MSESDVTPQGYNADFHGDVSRKGNWVQTYTGQAFYPLDPRPEEIKIQDIANALSKLCRYNGHTRHFYSVAEHSVLLARRAPSHLKLTTLLHDASEAYLADIVRPVKPSLVNYKEIEGRLMEVISQKFGTIWPLPSEVITLDHSILLDEIEQAMAKPPQPWGVEGTPLGATLQFWSPAKAAAEFVLAFFAFGGKA